MELWVCDGRGSLVVSVVVGVWSKHAVTLYDAPAGAAPHPRAARGGRKAGCASP